ncbi:alpha/beta fold hydrolase [Deinococcus multiflagellatus]|uniref:alpha/beta fold hydrolase n=1 Tax=Deinococcus multiflagellatus TaxID=1656887 RepID=UPI001CCFC81E|nr:alpha/beta fold hydrolase [Deinococcus multiflagellatus]MBZ9711914.1 alpha/beta fold hydrolase [Deinococcus multiflagellatus]
MAQSVFEHQGARLHVEHSGAGERPVVLIHGLSGSGRWWRFNVNALKAHHHVYTLELSGYGRARRQRALGVREAAALVAAWLEHENLQDVALVGHSMGGHVSMHVAARCPDRVTRLVLVCASGLLRANAARTALHLPRAALLGNRRFLSTILLDAALAGPVNLWRNAVNLLNDSVQDALPGIRARTLIIWGERDVLVPLPLGQLLHEALPGSRLEVIPRAGHIVMVDAPRAFNRLLRAFLDEPLNPQPAAPGPA